MKPKVFFNMSFEEYRALPGLNQSGAIALLRSPADYLAYLQDNKDTKSMKFGRMFHDLVGDKDFSKRWVTAPKFDKRTTEGKKQAGLFEAELIGKNVQFVTDEELDLGLAMRSRILGDEVCRSDLNIKDGFPQMATELVVQWEEQFEGGMVVLCKARLDFVCMDRHLVIDLKTTEENEERLVVNSIWTWGYYFQVYWYTVAYFAAFGVVPKFRFLFVSKEAPHTIFPVELSDAYFDVGKRKSRLAMERYYNCQFSGEWPTRPTSNTIIAEPPSWAG